MIVGERLRTLREEKGLTQGDIEKRTGLARTHISRLENDHTIPAIETLEKLAHALEIPLYVIFYEGGASPKPALPRRPKQPGESRKNARFVARLGRTLARIGERHRQLLMHLAGRMAHRRRPTPK
jgi:transcriptional regulator with XRE-family HTH domain